MFESQSSTPEGFQGNPESGIDQFLNQSAKAEALPKPVKPSYEELEQKLVSMTNSRDSYMDLFNNLTDKVSKAEAVFEEILLGHTDAKELAETFKEITDILGWEVTRPVQLEISVTWRGSIDLPIGVDVDDLDIDDFGLNEPEHSEYGGSFGYYGIHDYSIEER